MTTFESIPIEDIRYLLESYGIPVPKINYDAYVVAWDFISKNDNISVPESISDFPITLNLYQSNVNIPMIRILGYLDKMNNNMSLYDKLSP